MRVAELKALARERGLRGYSRMRIVEIIELIRNNQQSWAPDLPSRPNQTQSVRFRPDHQGSFHRPPGRAKPAGCNRWVGCKRQHHRACSTRNGHI